MDNRYLQIEIDRNYIADLDFKGEVVEIVVKTTEGEFVINKSDIKEKPKFKPMTAEEINDICDNLLEIWGEPKKKEVPKPIDVNELFKDDSFWD